jgi:hypothetical protein
MTICLFHKSSHVLERCNPVNYFTSLIDADTVAGIEKKKAPFKTYI